MKYRRSLWLTVAFAALALAGSELNAQAPKKGNAPPPSPEIQPDRKVTFRLRAPKATEVFVSGDFGGGNKAMTKDVQGVWSVTIGPLEPNVYGYGFSVDGVRMLDPGNSVVKPGRSVTTSVLDVPGMTAQPHEFNDVPHGTLRSHVYRSKSLAKLRNLVVYTPPGYEAIIPGRPAGATTTTTSSAAPGYPVLFLLHGSGDNEGTWTALGRAHFIFDNLIAAKKMKPMVVVMPDGHAAFSPAAPSPGKNAFESDLLGDVLPFVETNYRVQRNPLGRAIAGLSMGGGQSLSTGLNHPELFAWVGSFSAAIPQEATLAKPLADSGVTNKQFKHLWIACGKDDFLLKRNVEFDQLLTKRGIQHQFLETEGNHSWPVWRRYLVDFAPQLFQVR